MIRILIHGGAGNATLEALEPKQLATERSSGALEPLASALDLVEAAVAAQELEPELNAGLGSVVQLDGRIRMDAGICDSNDRYAAVIQIEHVVTPIRVARKLLDVGYHSILSGDGAVQFAREHGFPHRSPFTPAAFQTFQETRTQYPELSYAALTQDIAGINREKMGTVGAVALDAQGRLAAACSTGGTRFCYPGRVGDTPIFGAGVYCSKYVAVACTGEGDKVLRRLTARRVEDEFLRHGSLQRAAESALQDLLENQNGYGGLIAIAHTGESAIAHTTSTMAVASRSW